MYEIKPKKLWNTIKNKEKQLAAEVWCKNNNLEYILFEPKKIEFEEISHLVNTTQVIFIKRYQEKILLYNK